MIKRFVATIIASLGIVIFLPSTAMALPTHYVAADCGEGIASFLGLKSWDACLTKQNGVPQITKLTDIWLIVLPLLETAIKVAGYTAAGFVIWGGIKYLKSQGEPGETTQARQIIYNALFGFVLAMISVAIVNFVAGAL